MLIADEVGLGKTIVAKGLVAKVLVNLNPHQQKKPLILFISALIRPLPGRT